MTAFSGAVDDLGGVLVATRRVLWDAVERLPSHERTALRDDLSADVTELRRRWGGDLTPFRADVLDELERIAFRLRHPKKLGGSHESGEHKGSFFCIKCEAIATGSGMEISCPVCGGIEWLELVVHPIAPR